MAARLNLVARTIAASAPRPAAPATSPFSRLARPHIRMASSTPRTYEWLVVIPDKPGALAKRLEVRPQHFEGLTKLKESGKFKMGGAILEEMPPDDEVSSMKFSGSTLMIVAESKQEVIDLIKNDIYVESGVWDIEKAMIWPAKIAFRFP